MSLGLSFWWRQLFHASQRSVWYPCGKSFKKMFENWVDCSYKRMKCGNILCHRMRLAAAVAALNHVWSHCPAKDPTNIAATNPANLNSSRYQQCSDLICKIMIELFTVTVNDINAGAALRRYPPFSFELALFGCFRTAWYRLILPVTLIAMIRTLLQNRQKDKNQRYCCRFVFLSLKKTKLTCGSCFHSLSVVSSESSNWLFHCDANVNAPPRVTCPQSNEWRWKTRDWIKLNGLVFSLGNKLRTCCSADTFSSSINANWVTEWSRLPPLSRCVDPQPDDERRFVRRVVMPDVPAEEMALPATIRLLLWAPVAASVPFTSLRTHSPKFNSILPNENQLKYFHSPLWCCFRPSSTGDSCSRCCIHASSHFMNARWWCGENAKTSISGFLL